MNTSIKYALIGFLLSFLILIYLAPGISYIIISLLAAAICYGIGSIKDKSLAKKIFIGFLIAIIVIAASFAVYIFYTFRNW